MKFCFTLCVSLLLHAFDSAFGQGSISGLVKDGRGQPLAYVNVLLLQPQDSSLVKGSVSDETGTFSISPVRAGSYLIASSMVGYQTIYSSALAVTNKATRLDDLVLQEAVSELSEIVVQTSRPPFEQHLDKLVVNVKSSIISSGSSILEVLARTPGIAVNPQNSTITMNGKEGVMVMFNGKLTRMPLTAVVQMLSGMSADQVETIELISTPPAKYDAEGNAGLINIVNSQSLDAGTSGSFSANVGYGRYERAGTSLNLNHRSKKVSVYLDYSGMFNHFLMLTTNRWKIASPEQQTQSALTAERDFQVWTHNAQAGVEYALTPRTSIGSQFTAFSIKQDQSAYSQTEITQAGTPGRQTEAWDLERNHWRNFAINLNLTHQFSSDQTFSADVDYLYYFHNNPHNYRFIYHELPEDQQEKEQLVNSKHTPIHMWVGKIDYQHRLDDHLNLETGIKGFLSDVDNKIDAQRYREGIWRQDTLLSEHVLMEENIGAAYINLNATVDVRTKLQAGLRYEYTHTDLQTIDQQPILERNYGNLFPSVSFSRDINEDNTLQLSYSRRITRPTFNDLAPFFTLIDPFTYVGGNMKLLPSFSHTVQTSYQFKKTYQATLDVTHVRDIIGWDMLVIPDQNLQYIVKNNFDHSLNVSLTLSTPNTFAPWWEGHTSVQGVQQRVESVSQEVRVYRTMQYLRFNTTQTLKLGGGFSAELSGFYQGRSLTGLVAQKPFGALNVGLQKEFNVGTLKVSGEDLLWTQQFSFENSNAEVGSVSDLNIQLTTRLVRLSFTKKFGDTRIKSPRRATGSEEERKRVPGS